MLGSKVHDLLRARFTRPIAVATAAIALLASGPGTANAAIYWDDVELVNQASQQCLAGEYNGVVGGDPGTMVPGCMANGTGQIWLESAAPDTDGHANVHIMTWGAKSEWLCLDAGGPYSGPNGGTDTFWGSCYNGDSEIWTMLTAAPPQNVGNPRGLKHFINFYNVRENVCLDGGIGVYGFPGFLGRCNTSNNWQIWNIYTNAGSQPYTG
jgi:hypothetical protein